MAANSVAKIDFWRRRFGAFRAPPPTNPIEPNLSSLRPAGQLQAGLKHSGGSDSQLEDDISVALTQSVGTQSDRKNDKHANRSKRKRTEPAMVQFEARDKIGQVKTAYSFGDFSALLKLDAVHFALTVRETIWDRVNNRHLYPKAETSKLLLLASVLLFLVGSFFGGIAVLISAFLWRERTDG